MNLMAGVSSFCLRFQVSPLFFNRKVRKDLRKVHKDFFKLIYKIKRVRKAMWTKLCELCVYKHNFLRKKTL